MMLNRKYQIMLGEVRRLLNSKYSDKELLRLKDDIRGLALYGDLTDEECSNLLSMLPNISIGLKVEDDPEPDSEAAEDDSNESYVSGISQLAAARTERYYNHDDYEPENKKQSMGFESLAAMEVSRYYSGNRLKVEDDDDEDDDYYYQASHTKPEKVSGFSSLYNPQNGR